MPSITRPTRPQQWVFIDDTPTEPITTLMPAHNLHEMDHADGGGWLLNTAFAQPNEDEHYDADWHNAEETFDMVSHNDEETYELDSHNDEETSEHDSVRPQRLGGDSAHYSRSMEERLVALTMVDSSRTMPVRAPSPAPIPEANTGQHPHSTLQHEHDQLSHRYAILLESYHRVLGERQEAAAQDPQHEETIRDHEETIKDLNEDVDRLERERDGKNQELQDLRSAYAVVHSRACHLESKNAELSAENEQLKAKLAASEEAEWLHQQATRGPVPPLRRAKRAKATRRDSSESNSSSSSSSSAPEMTSSGSSSSSGESSNSAPAFMRRRANANYTGLPMRIPAIYARTHTSPSSTIRTESSFVDLPPSFVSSMDQIDLGPSYPFTDTAATTIAKFGRGVNDLDLGPSYDFTTTATATAVRPASSHHASRPANSVDDIDLGPTSPASPPATTTTAEGQNFIILNDNTNGVRIDRTRSRSVSEGGFVDVSPDEMAASDNQSLASGEGWRITEPAPLVTTTVEVSVDRA